MALLASGLLVGRLAGRRVAPAAEMLLFGLVTAIVLLEFASWSGASGGAFKELLDWVVPSH